jgi:hypothetical protein
MLKELNNFLIENNFQSIFQPANEVVFYDKIDINYFGVVDGQKTYWPIEIGDLPFGDDGMEGFKILQFYTPIIENISEDNYTKITDFTTRLNPKLTFGSFGFLKSHKLVYFKHNTMLAESSLAENCEIVQKTLLIIFFMLENFQKALAEVALGKISVDDAMETMPLNYIYQ